MTLPRFFAPVIVPTGEPVVLPPDEARHLTRVLRLRPGDRVEVFDGRGAEFIATVAAVDRDRVSLSLVTRCAPRPAPPVAFTLAQAVLKGEKMDDVVRDATMLGVTAIRPLISAHVASGIAALESGRPVERWRRVALASAKQCRRATLPAIAEPARFDEWLADASAEAHRGAATLFLVEPSTTATGTRSIRAVISSPAPPSAILAVGPEGGWSAHEVQTAVTAGLTPVSLGPLTLRADAVPLVALSALIAGWGE